MTTIYKPTKYNGDTKQQLWMSILSDSHDLHCGCDTPFAHILDSIFPVGHADRNKTIEEIIARDTPCHSGGDADADLGLALGASAATENIKLKEENADGQEEDIDELIAAAEAAERR